jgi:cytochrome P450
VIVSTQIEQPDAAALDCPVAWPRPGEGYGVGGAPFWDEQLGMWVISAYLDLDRVLSDAETFSSRSVHGPDRTAAHNAVVAGREDDPRVQMALNYFYLSVEPLDGEAHRRERSFVAKAFTPRRVKVWEPVVQELCAELTAAIVGRRDVPFVEEFAVPLPVKVIAKVLGMPPEDYLLHKQWSDAFQDILVIPEPTPDQVEAFLTTSAEFTNYMTPLIEQRRREPVADIISALVGENDAGERLTTEEILGICCALMLGGNETTTTAISGTMLYLLRTPGMQEMLRADPEAIPVFLEETIRLSCPVQALFRTATADVELGGVQIARGQHVYLRFAAANRDADQFEEALRPRLGREDKRHLAFGRGVHVCPGAPLARVELRIALEALLGATSAFVFSDRAEPVVAEGNHMTAAVAELYLDARV